MHDTVSEAASDSLIDLDVADGRPAGATAGQWRRLVAVKVPVLGVVALILAGAVAGAAGMHLWEVARQRSEVSLVLAVAGSESAGGELDRVTIKGSISVVNSGPMPVEVAGAANTDAFTLHGQQQIGPDETAWFTVTAVVPCADDGGVRPLPVDLSVVTSDGRRRTVTVDLQLAGSRWYDTVTLACYHMRGGEPQLRSIEIFTDKG